MIRERVKSSNKPANAFRDRLKVVVGSAEQLQVAQFTNAGRNAAEVELIAVYIQLAQTCQLAD